MTIVLIAAALYLLSTGLLVRGLASGRAAASRTWLWPAAAAVALHGGYHLSVAMRTSGGPDMHFFAALSLVALGMALLTTLVGARGRMAALGVLVFPLAALLLLAYATLSIAALLAIMLWLQERALRRRDFRPWLRALPPLADLEMLLFRTITVGFCLLTLTLVTGVLFVDDLLAQKLVHKTVLSVLSWLVFGTLLIGRRRHGWRGVKAVHWTLSAMVLLLLAFFGSQFVIELVFGHAR